MAEVSEKYNGVHLKGGSSPSIEMEYIIVGTSDMAEATAAMLAYAPATQGNMPIADFKADALTDDIWEGSVTYSFGQKSEQESDEETWAFDTSGGTSKVTQSVATVSYPRAGETAPDFKGAIGVSKNGVEGVTAPAPALQFSRKRRFAADFVTAAYIKTLSRLTGHYNNATFLGFDPGEVRFEGARGQQTRAGEPWDLEFLFNASENVTGLALGGGEITGIDKLGWEYLWILHEEAEDTAAKFVTPRPLAAYVEGLPTCQPRDFSLLGINVSG
jgi:hypothetical protein